MKKKKVSIPSIIKWVIALFLVIMQVYPFFYVFTSSFKSLDDFRKLPAYALPSKWILTNFINVFTKSHMLTYFKNSIIVLIGVLVPLLLFALMAGFALSKIKFRGRKIILNYFLLGLMLPMQVALIPLFSIFNKMGLINTYPAIIIPQIAFSLSYSIQLFYSFNKFFPEEMLEAAIIDGCSPMGCFFKMVVPMSLNSIITVATMQAVFCWNELSQSNPLVAIFAPKRGRILLLPLFSLLNNYQPNFLPIARIRLLIVLLLFLFRQTSLYFSIVSFK